MTILQTLVLRNSKIMKNKKIINMEIMTDTDKETVIKIIEGVGYYQAHNIVRDVFTTWTDEEVKSRCKECLQISNSRYNDNE